MDDFLQAGPKQHGFQKDRSDALADLAAQVVVIAVEIDKNLIAHYFGLAARIGKSLLAAHIALFDVGEVHIHHQLELVVDAVLHDALHRQKLLLGYLHGSLAYVAALAVPVGDEVLAFVFAPLVEVAVVLHAVFAEFYLGALGVGGAGNKHQNCKDE